LFLRLDKEITSLYITAYIIQVQYELIWFIYRLKLVKPVSTKAGVRNRQVKLTKIPTLRLYLKLVRLIHDSVINKISGLGFQLSTIFELYRGGQFY